MANAPRPRSLLLGWGNATPGQLAAYERLHRAVGLAPETVIADTAAGLLRPDEYVACVEDVARDLERTPEHGIALVHLFSDNGFIAWAALLERLARTAGGRQARDRIRGVVLDSSPGLWAAGGKREFARRFALAMTPLVARLAGRAQRETLPVVTPLLQAIFVAYQLGDPRAVRRLRGAAEIVATQQPRVPHLFLYAREDILVPVEDVEAWIRLQRRRGIPVEARCFGRARHVALYPADPKRYRAELAAFAARVARDGAVASREGSVA